MEARAATHHSAFTQGCRHWRKAVPAPPAPRRALQATPARRRALAPSAAADADSSTPPTEQQNQRQWQQQQHMMEYQQLWSEIEAAGNIAEELERSGQREEAIDQLRAALERLEAQSGGDFSLTVLRQMLWDSLYAAGRHRDALLVAAQVHAAVEQQFGRDAAELQLVSVRLGMSTAACGKLEAGLRLIYDAAPVLQHNLGRMVEQTQQLEAAGEELSEQEVATLQDNIDKLAAALGEANFYGSVYTIRHAAETGRATGVVEGWQELQAILVSGFCSLMAASGGHKGSATSSMLQEHDRLAHDMGAEPLLARLVKAQNEWVHDIADQGPTHPVFLQIMAAQLKET